MEREIDRRISASVCSDVVAVAVRCGEGGAQLKAEALDVLVDACSYPHLWS